MIQHTALQRNDTMSAKDRLRDAAREATLSKVVRQHPWGSVIAVGAGSLALTGLVSPINAGGRQTGGGLFGWLAALVTAAGGLSGPLGNIAMKAFEGYVMKKAVTGTEPAQPGEDT